MEEIRRIVLEQFLDHRSHEIQAEIPREDLEFWIQNGFFRSAQDYLKRLERDLNQLVQYRALGVG